MTLTINNQPTDETYTLTTHGGLKYNIKTSALGAKKLKITAPDGTVIENPSPELLEQINEYIQQINTNRPYIDAQGEANYYDTDQGEVKPAEEVSAPVNAVNQYFRRLNYDLANNKVPSGWYTLPAVGLAATGIGALMSAPIATTATMAGGWAGNKAVNLGMNLATGKSWAENMHDWTGLDKEPAEWTNPGMWLGAGLSNKALDATKQRILDVAYNNFTPLGYKDSPVFKFNHKQELKDMIKDFFSFKKIDTSPDTYPKWYQRMMENEKTNTTKYGGPDGIPIKNVIQYRDEAWRLATNQKPRLNLYKPNGDGTYSYNMDLVNKMEGGPKVRELFVKPTSNPDVVIGNDVITSNGGYVNIKLGPHNISDKGFYAGTLYAGKPSFTITDVWDLQPFANESRTFWPWLTKLGTDHPSMFGWTKNMEVLKPLGGNPFTLKLTFPEGTARIHIQPNKKLPK